MEIRHKKQIFHFELKNAAEAKPSFSVLHGRRFTLETEEGPIKISLKTLQKAVHKSKKLDAGQLENLRKEFVHMREKGYKKSKSYELGKYNIIVRITARILHRFSKKSYNKQMKKFGFYSQEILDKWNEEYDRIVQKHQAEKTNPRNELKKHRIELYQETKRTAQEGFFVGDKFVQLDPKITKNMIENQERFENDQLKPSTLPNPNYDTLFDFVDEDVLVLAESYLNKGLNPALLNLANAYNPGGGVEGGSGAQEESIFRRSNYHEALVPQKKTLYPIDKAQSIYTPSLQVFRTPEKDLTKDNQPGSYQFREPFTVDMIACAAIDLSGKHKIPDDFEELTRAKIRLILAIAVEKGHDSLVLGALGCGAFKNDPQLISRYFKEALESAEFKGRFKRVGFPIIYDQKLLSTFENQFTNL